MSGMRVMLAGGALGGVGLDVIPADNYILGITTTTEKNAGVPAGTVLTAYPGSNGLLRSITIDTPATVFENIDFGNVKIIVRAADVRFTRCRWYITDVGTTADNQAIIVCDSASVSNLRIEFCDLINVDQRAYNLDAAIRGHDMDVFRCKIMGTMDGVRPNLGPRWSVRGTFIGFLGWWAASTNGVVQPNDVQTHSDCIQTTYGGGQVIGSTLLAYPSTVVGTGTPGSGSDQGNTRTEYTYAQAVARRAQLMGSVWTEAAKSYGGVSREVGGVITPLMCNIASGATAMNLIVKWNTFGGGSVQVNALASNLTAPLGLFYGNRHYNDSKFKVAGKAIGYRLSAVVSSTADIPQTGENANRYMDDLSVVPKG